MVHPLYNLTKANTPLVLTEKCAKAFEFLKIKLTTSPILILPDFKKSFFMHSDASRHGNGGVLIQKDENGNERPLYFQNCTLSKHEIQYGITELEGIAAYYSVIKFRPFISSSHLLPLCLHIINLLFIFLIPKNLLAGT